MPLRLLILVLVAIPGLIHGASHDPAWSPDGRYVAFEHEAEGNADIRLLDIRSGRVQRLTDHEAADFHPSFSADGRHIAFQSKRTGRYQIYVVDIASGEITRITDSAGNATSPDWSDPLGGIVYADVGADDRTAITLIDPVTHEEEVLAGFDGLMLKPAVSPDGRRIAAFLLDTETFDADIWVTVTATGESVCWTCGDGD